MENFDVELLGGTEEYKDVLVKSNEAEGLPPYSPTFVLEIIAAINSDLHINARETKFDAPESKGLKELRVRVFPHQ